MDKMYKDVMETARDSGNQELAENTLRHFVDDGNQACFAACLYTCYDLIRPDVALELGWRKGMTDFAMPYLIQVLRDYTGRIDALDKKTQKKEEDDEKNKSASNDYVPDYMMPPMMPGMGNLMLTGGPTMQPAGGGFPPVGGNMMGGMPGPNPTMIQTPMGMM